MNIHERERMADGRYWGSAEIATLTEHSDGSATIRFEWDDGACRTCWEETSAEAREHLRALGYAA